ncbi:MAG TPA: class I SAM-dependent methyltransferase [Vicinamibacterales bacterium]|nr:class I SAM-dependent methyltransferase [Vicinamibacterales bacterium]
MDLRSTLFKLYWRMRRAIAPSLRYSQYTYEESLRRHVAPETRWIDIGCGHSILPSWRANEERQLVQQCRVLVGIDYDLPSLQAHPSIQWRVRGDVTKLPFQNAAFDLVTANMVVEHLDSPEAQFREVSRLLRPKGLFLFHTPNALGYGVMLGRLLPDAVKRRLARVLQGREAHDVFETYYRANTEARIRELASASGFTVATVDIFVADAVFAMIPPLAFLELLWLRLLMTRPFRQFRTNIITVLQKAPEARA